MNDYNILKTSNHAEIAFRHSQYDMKNHFKTTWGNINYIQPKIQYQNERNGIEKDFNGHIYG
ncbi:MAG: hypothetical protein FWH29_02985 [Methanobrevibacter sp.]|nr:hypothetical protein [Methanobrevibacter sp.]